MGFFEFVSADSSWPVFYFIHFHCGMGLGCPDCVTLYIAFTLFGSSWSDFCFSIPEGKTTLDVFYRLTGTALHGSHRAVT